LSSRLNSSSAALPRQPEARCAELRAEFFGDVQAPEVKHSLLRKYARGQRSVGDFVRALAASEPGAVV
jgi:hypothetical protein